MNTTNPNVFIPALPPPPGETAKYIAISPMAYVYYSIVGFLLFVMLACFSIRTYTKVCLVKRFTWDDVTSTIAALGGIYDFVSGILLIQFNHVGLHVWNVPLSVVLDGKFYLGIFLVGPVPTIFLYAARMSFVILYFQIFKPMQLIRVSCYTVGTLMTLFYFPVLICQFVYSSPPPGQGWADMLHDQDQIAKLRSLFWPLGISGLVFDLFLLVIPLVGVSRLHMTLKRKLAICAVFAAGSVAVLSSALSIYFRIESVRDAYDSTYPELGHKIVSDVELLVGIIGYCTPSLSMFYSHIRPRVDKSWLSNSSAQTPKEGTPNAPPNSKKKNSRNTYDSLGPLESGTSTLPVSPVAEVGEKKYNAWVSAGSVNSLNRDL